MVSENAKEPPAAAAQGAPVAPAKAAPRKRPTTKKNAPQAKRGAKKAARRSKAAKPAATPSAGSKKAIVMDLLKRKQGATLADIAKATGWQDHSIRGFISGTLGKKMGLDVESFKNTTDERTYRIVNAEVKHGK